MNESFSILLALVTGVALGGVFFGGLWWTIRKATISPQPALWFFGSLVLRMGVALTGFFLIGRGHWERLVLCLAGFVVGRIIVTLITRPAPHEHGRPAVEVTHAIEP